MKLTLPQREMLAQIGSYDFGYKPKEYNFGSKTRLCEKLVTLGLACHYPHGGFAITEAGKQVLSTPIGTPPPLAIMQPISVMPPLDTPLAVRVNGGLMPTGKRHIWHTTGYWNGIKFNCREDCSHKYPDGLHNITHWYQLPQITDTTAETEE